MAYVKPGVTVTQEQSEPFNLGKYGEDEYTDYMANLFIESISSTKLHQSLLRAMFVEYIEEVRARQ